MPLVTFLADTQVPQVSIASPAAGANLTGADRRRQRLRQPGARVGRGEGGQRRLRACERDHELVDRDRHERAYASGSHTLIARATDTAGNKAWTSATVTFNSSVDPVLPTVSFDEPPTRARR